MILYQHCKKLEKDLKKMGFVSEKYDGRLKHLVFCIKKFDDGVKRRLWVIPISLYGSAVKIVDGHQIDHIYNFYVPNIAVISTIKWILQEEKDVENYIKNLQKNRSPHETALNTRHPLTRNLPYRAI